MIAINSMVAQCVAHAVAAARVNNGNGENKNGGNIFPFHLFNYTYLGTRHLQRFALI
jgi:hypothetical protein